ncbi:MAG: cytochrome c biogenesis protein ResB, partial [Deltaproteobacteria bacterium]|nr:cytochrome c biogenesis protein ResB [Deltaproteobacteria bacterium]
TGDGSRAHLDLTRQGTTINISGSRITLMDFSLSQYAVLNINKDPGIWLIIIGSAILVAGIILIFIMRGDKAELVRT